MEIAVVGATTQDKEQVKRLADKDVMLFDGAHDANICYTGKHYDDIVEEAEERTLRRIDGTLERGHHSVHEHPHLGLYLRDVPKILAMFLNNEKMYVTSEKSARYTKMKPSNEEKELYDDWMSRFVEAISKKYPGIDEKKRKKLAQENARYLTSVFTPTSMKYTISFRQLNYVMHMFDDFVDSAEDTAFNARLKPFMSEFVDQLRHLYVEKLDPKKKRRGLSLIASRDDFKDHFGDTYCISYSGSFAYLAQAHRHRTLNYQMQPVSECDHFFIPSILDDESVPRWIDDLLSVASNFPQGSLVRITERGTYEDFISKVNERLCGQAQFETMRRTKSILDSYLSSTSQDNPSVHAELLPYANGPKCTFPDHECGEPCLFGKKALERLV